MSKLKDFLAQVPPGTALGHFNISDSPALRAIFEAARELNLPVVIGTSEGEREFLGTRQAVALIRSLREEFQYPIFLNADHTHSLEHAQLAARAGYDAILFDGSKLSWEENIIQTQAVVAAVKEIDPEILVEGEIGYIGSSSELLRELPAGAAFRPEDLTTPEQAREFVEKTGVDLLAPAVGNIHGMLMTGSNPRLDIPRIQAIRGAVSVPLVLHGGSGIAEEDFRAAIMAGIGMIHINTELRRAWRKGVEEGLKEPAITPYKILAPALEYMKEVAYSRLHLFNRTGELSKTE